MSKVNNVVRFYDFKSENELYSKIDTDLETCSIDKRIYRLQTVQIINSNQALVVMEEDTDCVPVIFFYKHQKDSEVVYEELILDDLPSNYLVMSVKELEMIKSLGKITVSDIDYKIDKMEYIIENNGEKYMQVILKHDCESEEK